MVHKHSVRDTNAHFTIDQFTRQIKNDSAEKTTIVQYDHNSQRLTFSMPLQIDSHAMTLCDLIEIHFINISTDGKKQNSGLYEVNDIKAEGDKAIFTWLISQEATQLAGTLNFFIVFKCTENGVTVYRWGTEICKTLAISAGMDNGETVLTEYPDILAQWKAQLFDTSNTAVVNVATAEASALAAIEAAGEAKKQAVLDSIPDEYEALSALADQNHRNKAGAIVLDAEGESIVLSDASEYPLQGLKLFGKSTQDGTPTPDAPVDIVSVELSALQVFGGNLLDLHNLTILTNTSKSVSDDGYTVTVTGGANGRYVSSALRLDTKLLAGKTLIFKHDKQTNTQTGVGAGSQLMVQSPSKTDYWTLSSSVSYREITIPDDVNLIQLGIYTNNSGTALETDNTVTVEGLMLSIADIPWTPYVEKQNLATSRTLPGIPVSSGGNYTDENGQQWICDEVDLKRGVYVQRIKKDVLDGNEPWKMSTTDYGEVTYFFAAYSDMINTNGDNMGAVMCDMFIESYNINTIEHIRVHGMAGQLMLFIKTNRLDEVSTSGLKAWFAGHNANLMYQLATPIETPLSDAEITAFRALHSNKPNTTILNDAGAHMAVSYVADTKTYIDRQIAALLSNKT